MEKRNTTLSLCMIGKDEEACVGACLESVIDRVDEIVFVDTGSTDRTMEIVKDIASSKRVPCNIIQQPWADDFSFHRNTSFDAATGEWILWLDCDDTVVNMEAARKAIEDASFDVMHILYEYARDENGNVTVLHWRDRFIRNIRTSDGRCFVRWEDPVHEYLTNVDCLVHTFFHDTRVVHNTGFRDKSSNKFSGRNLSILEKAIQRDGGYEKTSLRRLSYAFRELLAQNRLDEAMEALEVYSRRAPDCEEKLQMYCNAASLLFDRGGADRARELALKALAINPSWPDPYLVLAQAELIRSNPDAAIALANAAMSLPPPQTHLITNPWFLSYVPRALRCKANIIRQDYQAALEDMNALLEMQKDAKNPDQDLKADIDFVMRELHNRKELESILPVAEYIAPEKVGGLPEHVRSSPEFQRKIHDVMVDFAFPEKGSRPSVVFYSSGYYEPWCPQDIASKGLGGSETALANLTRSIARLGVDVTVYARTGHKFGVYDGVLFLPDTSFSPEKVKADVFVSFRAADAGMWNTEGCREKVLWVQDASLGRRLEITGRKFDRFMFVSEWQKKRYSHLYGPHMEERGVVVPNALDVDLLWQTLDEVAGGEDECPRDAVRFVYTSSPDRGLEALLRMWPDIKERIPQASLRIFYGWKLVDSMISSGVVGMAEMKQRILGLLEALKPLDVEFVGEVGQRELYLNLWRSGYWVYPTHFLETSCIAAMEAAFCGLNIITSPRGALPETLGDAAFYIDGSPRCPKVRKRYVDTIVDIYESMKDESGQNAFMERVLENSRKFAVSYDDVARDWVREFLGMEVKSEKAGG